jgi:hypothetical protein
MTVAEFTLLDLNTVGPRIEGLFLSRKNDTAANSHLSRRRRF